MRTSKLAVLALLLGAPALAAIAEDTGSSFPLCVQSVATAGTTVSVTGITTSTAGDLLVGAFVCGDETNIWGTTGSDITFGGASLSWTNRIQNSYLSGSFLGYFGAAVYTAVASGTLSNQTATITSVSSNAKTCSFCVYALTGACTTAFGATGGENDPSGATNQTVSATLSVVAANSFLVGAFGDGDSSAGDTANANTTFDKAFTDGSTGAGYIVAHKTTLTSGAGSVTFGSSTSDLYNATAGLEVLDVAASQCSGATAKPSRSLLGVGSRRAKVQRPRLPLPPRAGLWRLWNSLTHVSTYPREVKL